jgi:S1-C subfamily serine protease
MDITFKSPRHRATAAIVLCLILVSSDSPRAQDDFSFHYARLAPSTVTIVSMSSDGEIMMFGSGVAVGDGQTLLTNHHVVKDAYAILIVCQDTSEEGGYPAYITAHAPELDLATLRLAGSKTLDAIPMATELPAVGAKAYAIGSPRGLSGTLTEGIVSAIRVRGGYPVIQTTAPISPGSSGGGLFNAEGQLIGITTESMSEGQQLNFAVSVLATQALEELAVESTENAVTPDVSSEDLQVTPDDLDAMADLIFHAKHPELRGRKIRSNEKRLAEEWLAIRNGPSLVDFVFYLIHPELRGRKIKKSETELGREWLNIQEFIKQIDRSRRY